MKKKRDKNNNSELNRFKKILKKEYPECLKCPHLNIENVRTGKVVCFYRIKDKCILDK